MTRSWVYISDLIITKSIITALIKNNSYRDWLTKISLAEEKKIINL